MKTKLSILIALISLGLNAQNFTGKAIYKTSKKSNISFGDNQQGISDKMQEELKARMQKMNQKTFILEFDKKTSIYKEEVSLESPKSQIGGAGVVVMNLGGSGSTDVYYKNINQKRFANQTEIQGKRFLVKDKLPTHNWELSSETKNIGNYTCYKASYTKEIESKNISMLNSETTEDVKKVKVTTTAWYTTQVPVSNGPANYQGLPGLILEINNGEKTIVCTEIILNPSEKISIQEPKKGKVVSQNKFSEIKLKKTNEMLEKFKSRKGFDLGNGTTIKMGG